MNDKVTGAKALCLFAIHGTAEAKPRSNSDQCEQF